LFSHEDEALDVSSVVAMVISFFYLASMPPFSGAPRA